MRELRHCICCHRPDLIRLADRPPALQTARLKPPCRQTGERVFGGGRTARPRPGEGPGRRIPAAFYWHPCRNCARVAWGLVDMRPAKPPLDRCGGSSVWASNRSVMSRLFQTGNDSGRAFSSFGRAVFNRVAADVSAPNELASRGGTSIILPWGTAGSPSDGFRPSSAQTRFGEEIARGWNKSPNYTRRCSWPMRPFVPKRAIFADRIRTLHEKLQAKLNGMTSVLSYFVMGESIDDRNVIETRLAH